MITIKYMNSIIYLMIKQNNFDNCENRSYIIEKVCDEYYFVYFMINNVAIQINDFDDLKLSVEFVKLKIESEVLLM